MSGNGRPHRHKVRLTIECSLDEKTHIKILAAEKQMTISDFILAPIRQLIQSDLGHEPNAETIEALKESRESELKSYKTPEDFWKSNGINQKPLI